MTGSNVKIEDILAEGKFMGVDISLIYVLGMVRETAEMNMLLANGVLTCATRLNRDGALDKQWGRNGFMLLWDSTRNIRQDASQYMDALNAMGQFLSVLEDANVTFEDLPTLLE